jgi:hypothetical protein
MMFAEGTQRNPGNDRDYRYQQDSSKRPIAMISRKAQISFDAALFR